MKIIADPFVIASLTIGIGAAIGTIVNALALIRFSKINLMATIQNQMLAKAMDCNAIDQKRTNTGSTWELEYGTLISEIEISVKLLDSTLMAINNNYLKSKRKFLLEQFWIQLNDSIRIFISYSFIEDDPVGKLISSPETDYFLARFHHVKSYFVAYI